MDLQSCMRNTLQVKFVQGLYLYSLKPVASKVLRRTFWWLRLRIHLFWLLIMTMETQWALIPFILRNRPELSSWKFLVCIIIFILSFFEWGPVSNTVIIFLLLTADGQDTSARGNSASNGIESGKANPTENGMSKQLLALQCSEKAAYVYSLNHVVQVKGLPFLVDCLS